MSPSTMHVHNSFSVPYRFTGVLSLMILLSGAVSCAYADIYRFVTVDGVESFTDTPLDKSATVVMKDRQSPSAKKRTAPVNKKTHTISLDEIARKTVAASLPHTDLNPVPSVLHLSDMGGTVTSRVGMRIDPIDGVLRQHNGIDIAIPSGTPVRPAAPGVVLYSGYRSGYGNTILIEHENGVVTLYAHNNRNLVAEGQSVTSEHTIALSGSTGRSTGPHLHFEAWQQGVNITETFLPTSGQERTEQPLRIAEGIKQRARFRSEVLSDGSILFTNMPQSHP